MTTNAQGESAKIYAFPARGRFAPSYQRSDAGLTPAAKTVPTVAGAWYHDEAIREAELPRKN